MWRESMKKFISALVAGAMLAVAAAPALAGPGGPGPGPGWGPGPGPAGMPRLRRLPAAVGVGGTAIGVPVTGFCPSV